MLFKKNEYRFCANCARGAALENGRILCAKKGLVADDGSCGAFRYDPLKRTPARRKPPEFQQFLDTDFTL